MDKSVPQVQSTKDKSVPHAQSVQAFTPFDTPKQANYFTQTVHFTPQQTSPITQKSDLLKAVEHKVTTKMLFKSCDV